MEKYKTLIFFLIIKFMSIVCEPVQFGKHSPVAVDKGINLIGKFSSPGVFYEHFVKPGIPLLMKSVLDEPIVKFPAYTYWIKDDYLRDNFGDEEFNVESQKKENRKKKSSKMVLRDILDQYKTRPIYLVDSVSQRMKDDLALPLTLQCGGFERSIQDAVLWFSSGGTSSVLHTDPLNNLLCVLDGSKDVYFIDKKYKSDVESVGFVDEGSYSTLDVDNVDYKKYKTLLTIPYERTHVDKGDCVFIPYGWYHQVRSNGRRNMAVNFWFTQRWWFNHPDCLFYEKFNYTEPLNKYTFTSTNEIVRFQMLQPYKDLEVIKKSEFLEPDVDKDRRLKLFNFINLDGDSYLTWEELYHCDIDDVVKQFSDALALNYVRNMTGEEEQKKDVKDEL